MSETNPKVAVVIPTYNGLPFLKEAVRSVLNQTYRNLILYVVNDGSTDQTDQYVHNLVDPRVRYLSKENGGLASARNYGIRHSKEPFIAFLDADDLWHPKKLEKQMALMVKNPALGMVYGFQNTIESGGHVIGSREYGNRGWVFDILLGGNFITGSGSMVLVRSEVFNRVGFFREDFKIGEDWEMWLRIAKEFEVDFVPEYLAAIRVRGESMQRNFLRMAEGLKYMLPAVLSEFNLSPNQRNKLVCTVLVDSAVNYWLAHSYKASILTLREMLQSSPDPRFYSGRIFEGIKLVIKEDLFKRGK